MGSALWREIGPGVHQEIWGENLRRNYEHLCKNPALLTWHGEHAKASMLEKLEFRKLNTVFFRCRLWKAVLDGLARVADFQGPNGIIKLGYDWRACLLESSERLMYSLGSSIKANLSEFPTPEEAKLTFVTHSMGGLLASVGIGQGILVCPLRVHP